MPFRTPSQPPSRHLLATIGVLLGFTAFPAAGAETLPLDARGSSVTFVGDAFLHRFRGEAKEISGRATFDGKATPPIQTATLQFKTAALTTFRADRDQKMKEWLQVQLHPEATFVLQQVRLVQGDHRTATAARPAKFTVSGSLTLHGVKQPISTTALGWREKNRLIVTGETVLDTLQFGLPQIREALVLSVATAVKTTFRLSFVLPADLAAQ